MKNAIDYLCVLAEKYVFSLYEKENSAARNELAKLLREFRFVEKREFAQAIRLVYQSLGEIVKQ